ncbi:MAG: D-arabinono-1,4-lactone oxidase [Cytophagales bacterium]|nr:D-arabinono-1,4-lactone oxidase [Cytophagales bacterium]
MDSLVINAATYWLPESIPEVMSLVNDARTGGEIICVRGSAHSFPLIGDLEKGSSHGRKYKYVMLSKLNAVAITGTMVTVQAGCNLGPDPWDPTGISSLEKSLLYKLDQQGLSIPDLGGITHQTVGGFLSTGSSGGSCTYSFEDALMAVDIVTCGKSGAAVTTFRRPADNNPDDPFFGVGIASLGLFGIIVSATFQCHKKFFIAGQEATTTEDGCEIALFTNDGTKPSLQKFLEETQYTRLIWWPQQHVNKMVVWKAWQATESDAKKWAYPNDPNPDAQPLKQYQEVPWIDDSPTPANLGAHFLFSAMGRWPTWLINAMGDNIKSQTLINLVDVSFYPLIFPAVLDIFVKLDGPDGPQRFCDVWYTGLPMDNQMSDKLMPVWFTELWISIDQTQQVMAALKKFYDDKPENAGKFSCEIYGTKSNMFWLSPSYGTDVVRIDVFWYADSSGDPREYYQKFWELLAPYKFRPHWGKYLPAPDSQQGVSYLQGNYPKWQAWKNLRDELDPYQLFVNDYWRAQLDIAVLK